MKEELIVDANDAGQRLDVWCASRLPSHSRSAIQKAIKDGSITTNGEIVKPRYAIHEGDSISVDVEDTHKVEAPDTTTLAVPALFENDDILVINKPAGVSVHPAENAHQGPTISDWFKDKFPKSAAVGDPSRPGIVHRLDKDTSGVMVLAKTDQAYKRLKEQFKRHRVRKEYLALVFGIPGESKGRITRAIGRSPRNPTRRTVIETGKPAITEWKIEETFGNDYALVRAYPLTGRTHQIRVHMHHLGFPIVGDALYTFKRKRSPEGTKRQLLHAESLMVQLMDGKKKTFKSELADDYALVLENLRDGRH